jgi:hypothetical protein
MDFEWNLKKAEINSQKHGVSFEEAAGVFGDYFSWTYPDLVHSINEPRYINIGLSDKNRLLIVVHTQRGETIRIISARPATKREKNYYESQRQ